MSVFLPILEWTDEDVDEFINAYNIQCAPVYYDEEGKFHVERRLGVHVLPPGIKKEEAGGISQASENGAIVCQSM